MRSLRLKLIVGSLLVLAAVILSFDVFIFFAKRNALLDILDGRLFAESQSIALRLEISGGKPAFDPAEDNGARPATSSLFRIVDENGKIVFQSPRSAELNWPAVPKDAASPHWTTTRSAGGEAFRTATWVDRVEIDKESSEKSAENTVLSMPARPAGFNSMIL